MMFIEPLERPSSSRRFRIIAASLLALLLSAVILYNETPLSRGKSVFYLPSSSPEALSDALQKSGYRLNLIDNLLLHLIHPPEEGWYRVYGNEAGRYSFFKNLYKKRVKTLRIRIFAGETKEEIFRRLSKELMLDEKRLDGNYSKFARFEEGNILAGRYPLPRSADEEAVMQYMIDRSDTTLDQFARETFGFHFPLEALRKTLIIASIIQRESNDPDDMTCISSVIQNRLKKGMRLQMDGTLNYGRYSRTIVTAERIRNDHSRYNTYRHKGLVPTPLGSVSMEALRAAASPRKSDYLFFVLNKNGKHTFAATYRQHIENVKAFKSYCRQRDEKRKKAGEKQKRQAAKAIKIKKRAKVKKADSKKVRIEMKERGNGTIDGNSSGERNSNINAV